MKRFTVFRDGLIVAANDHERVSAKERFTDGVKLARSHRDPALNLID